MKLGFRRERRIGALVICLTLLWAGAALGRARADAGQNKKQYQNFRVAVYIPVFVVKQMEDPTFLQSSWDTISRQVKVDKVYIETYRSRQIACLLYTSTKWKSAQRIVRRRGRTNTRRRPRSVA